MKQDDFSSNKFVLSIVINTNRRSAFDYFETSNGLTLWLLEKAVYKDKRNNMQDEVLRASTGHAYYWKWKKQFSLEGTILEIVPLEKFCFSFGNASNVEVYFKTLGNRTMITLTQFNLKVSNSYDFDFINCCVCWGFFLTNLKSVADHNTDLRELSIFDEALINQ